MGSLISKPPTNCACRIVTLNIRLSSRRPPLPQFEHFRPVQSDHDAAPGLLDPFSLLPFQLVMQDTITSLSHFFHTRYPLASAHYVRERLAREFAAQEDGRGDDLWVGCAVGCIGTHDVVLEPWTYSWMTLLSVRFKK